MINRMKHALIDSLKRQDKTQFDLIIKEMHPIDIAETLQHSTEKELKTFIEYTNPEFHAKILEQASDKLQLRIIRLLEYSETVHLFSHMSKDDVADTLGKLPINVRKDLLNEMKDSEHASVESLLGYAKDTAGSIMTTEYIALSNELTIKDALDKIKEIGPKTEVIEIIFILNNKNELIGTADLRDILTSDETKKLKTITNENTLTVYPETDQEKVALLVSRYDLKAIAVVNQMNNLLGIITVDDIIDVMVIEQSEDILHLGGVSGQETTDSTIIDSVKRRIPWLMINLGTAFLAAFVVTQFEYVIVQVVALASSMSVVTGMGGNAGNQTLSVVIRSIALGELELKKHWKRVFREMAVGFLQGAFVGFLAGTIMYLRNGNPMLGVIMFLAMIGNMVVASISGFLVPLTLKQFGFDPALGSSIFLTASTDILGFLLYLGLATLFLPYLI